MPPIPYTLGIDVFHGDGPIAWPQVLAAGYSFGFAKATEGLGSPDPRLAENWKAMGACGITRGSFHFLHPEIDGAEQAKHFVAAMSAVGGFTDAVKLPVLDLETTGGQPSAAVVACGKLFVQTVAELLDLDPTDILLYTSPGFASSAPDGGRLFGHTFGAGGLGCKLWVSHYTSAPVPIVPFGWAHWSFWQFAMAEWSSAADGPRPLQPAGCARPVDSNRYRGTHADLVAEFTGG